MYCNKFKHEEKSFRRRKAKKASLFFRKLVTLPLLLRLLRDLSETLTDFETTRLSIKRADSVPHIAVTFLFSFRLHANSTSPPSLSRTTLLHSQIHNSLPRALEQVDSSEADDTLSSTLFISFELLTFTLYLGGQGDTRNMTIENDVSATVSPACYRRTSFPS